MSNAVPYFKFVISEWQSGKISRRPLEERAILLEIMLAAFSKGGWMPWGEYDREDFADVMGLDDEHLQKVVNGFERRGIVIIENDRISTKFVVETSERVTATRNKRRESGRAGGLRRAANAGQDPSKCLASAKQVLEETQASACPVEAGSKPKPAKRFVPPTAEQVAAYVSERTQQGKPFVEAERFVDHYTANGWRVGKNPMKDWKAAVRTWEKGSASTDSSARYAHGNQPGKYKDIGIDA